jgi:hypothetical protein
VAHVPPGLALDEPGHYGIDVDASLDRRRSKIVQRDPAGSFQFDDPCAAIRVPPWLCWMSSAATRPKSRVASGASAPIVDRQSTRAGAAAFDPKGMIPYHIFFSERTSLARFRQVWRVTGKSMPSNSVKMYVASRSPT